MTNVSNHSQGPLIFSKHPSLTLAHPMKQFTAEFQYWWSAMWRDEDFPLWYYSEKPALSTDCWQAFLERFCFSVYVHAFSDTHTQKAQSPQRQRLDVVRCCSEKLCCRLRSSRSRKRYQRHNENVSSSSKVRHEGLTSSESQADFCVRISLSAGVK